jgi:ribosomal protein S18 acetylase RimI-like enzyme
MNDTHVQTFPKAAHHEVLIRTATPADARAVAAVLRSAFLEFQELYTPQAFVATVQPESGILTRLNEGPLWVAEKESVVLGTVSAVRAEDSVMVRGMAVDCRARGLGIGKTLLKVAEGFARELGCGRVSLYTAAFLRAAIHLYQSSGFQFTGETASPHGTELLRMVKVFGDRRDDI